MFAIAQRTWYWELLSMTRKLVMAMTTVFANKFAQMQLQLMLFQNVIWFLLLVISSLTCHSFQGWSSRSIT